MNNKKYFSAGQDVATSTHGAANEDGLTGQLVIHGTQWVVRRESSSGSLKIKK